MRSGHRTIQPNESPLRRSVPRLLSGCRSGTQQRYRWRQWCLAICTALGLALTALNLAAEHGVYVALHELDASPQRRYILLVRAARLYPFDRNLRDLPKNFLDALDAKAKYKRN